MITVTSQEIEMRTNYDRVPSIEDSGERIFLLAYNCILLLSSLLGDTIIIVATTKYTAIKLHAVIVVIIQHLTVCNILAVALKIVPNMISLIFDDWVLGDFYGHLQANLGSFVQGVTLMLTCGMSTVKLLNVKYPFRSRTWSPKVGHQICAALWLFQFTLTLPSIFVDMKYLKDTLIFDYTIYQCIYLYDTTKTPSWYSAFVGIGVAVVMMIAVTIMLVTSIFILIIARKSAERHGKSLRLEGVMTVVMTVAIFLGTYLPYTITVMVYSFHAFSEQQGFSITLVRCVVFLMNANIAANFFIYTLTVTSFRAFLHNGVSKIFSRKSFPDSSRSAQGKADTIILSCDANKT